MQTFTITLGNLKSRSDYMQAKITSQVELIHLFAEKSSISIKQVQELNEPLSISARLPRIVWIEEANLLTIPAQNALLKMLEEPPAQTEFYLTCSARTALLPTILSRAKNILLEKSDSPDDPSVLADLKGIMAMTAGDRLASIVKRDRAESIIWISQIETALKTVLRDKNLNDHNYKMLGSIASSALSAHSALLANCSVGLTTQNFYLTLPHTHSTR